MKDKFCNIVFATLLALMQYLILLEKFTMSVVAPSVDGPIFNITKVNRLQMGAYLCIASNGVPPTVSKRILLLVHCKYFTQKCAVLL